MTTKNSKLLLIIIGALLLLGGVVFIFAGRGLQNVQLEPGTVENRQSSQFVVGQKAPDFTLKDFEGNEVRLSDLYGNKAVVLDFWAAWCPFCIDEMPELQKAQDQYRDDLVMIGVHRTDSGESITTGKKFADEQGVTYLLVQGTSEVYKASTTGVQGMPVAVFIDKEGIVRDIKIGPKTEREINEKVEKLIKQ